MSAEQVDKVEDVTDATEKQEESVETPKKRSPFITEKDTFGFKVRFHNSSESGGFIVENVHDTFQESNPTLQEVEIVCKYPNQGDTSYIATFNTEQLVEGSDEMMMRGIQKLEFSRLCVLVRSWTFDAPFNQESVLNLDPDVIKGINAGIREELGLKGII